MSRKKLSDYQTDDLRKKVREVSDAELERLAGHYLDRLQNYTGPSEIRRKLDAERSEIILREHMRRQPRATRLLHAISPGERTRLRDLYDLLTTY